MPQLDLTTYSSQIFWFTICFAILYFFASKIILPRIHAILKDRKAVIDADLSAAAKLDDEIHGIQIKTDILRKDANKQYQLKLEEVAKEAAKQREKMIEELKEKFDQITQKSRQELRDFIEKSHTQSELAVKDLVQKITEKLLNKESL